ncbi:uncharacterized protein LOC128218699 [Mya arenaria]|uniref:uncharacterized protein LOC128218699 n=1 Tax=Mya arenaria TaxID=6604 RepID=UPI0022E41244|nr:uncharacterized protein LOC128218699 [Mya arenaria]XP_052782326.1 uncharacterized protein LOC128218699 [Mya arenaria]
MSDGTPAKRQKLGEEPCKGRCLKELEGLEYNLVQYNLSENTKLTLGPFFQKENPDLDAFYVPPTLSKVLPMRLATGYASYEKEPITSLEQLLNPLDRRKRFSCITSNAGLGKTSFCKFLARLWCAVKKNDIYLLEEFKGKADYLHDVEYLRKFNYLFFVSLKDVEGNNLNVEDIIFSHLRNNIDDRWDNENNKRILQNDLTEKHSLIILDGLDEINLSKFMFPLECRKYTIICTSRPWKLGALGMPTSKYTEIQLDEMTSESTHKLLKHANVCLNSQSVLKRDIDEFFTVLTEQNLENLLPNPLIALQLLCIYHDRYDINTTGTKRHLLGKTRTHMYANVVDMMFKLAEEKAPTSFEKLRKNDHDKGIILPTGFAEAETCNSIPSFVYNLGRLAFDDILRQSEKQDSLVSLYVQDKLDQDEQIFLLTSGLITGTASTKFSAKTMVYTFLHKTYEEMLACVYISTLPLNSNHWHCFESYFKANVSSDMMSFLCVMNNEQGEKCSEMYSSIERVFYRDGKYHENELISYQNAVLMAFEECINSGTLKAGIVLKHMLIDRKKNTGPPCPLVVQNMHNIDTLHLISSEREKDIDVEFRDNIKLTSLRTLIITGNNDTLMLETLTEPSCGHLRFLFINDVELKQKHLDLTGCTHLSNIELENVCFSSVQINAENLEQFWMYFETQFQQTWLPTELELKLKGNFSAKLKELSVMYVKLNIAIDLSECVNLQKLVLEHISSSADYNAKCFQNFEHLTRLKELRLDSLQYPNNATIDLSGMKDLEHLRIVNVKMNKAVIAAENLSELWVYYSKPIANTIKPLIVSVPMSSTFTNNLEQLSLVHVELNGQFDLSQSCRLKQMIVRNVSTEQGMAVLDVLANCNDMEDLRIEALNSHENKVLDMSHMTNLKCLYIDVLTLDVQIEKIPTENLEIFWTYTSEPKQQIRPPKELHLPENAKFTRCIRELSLENVHVDETDLSMCENLSILRVDEMSQSVVKTVCSDSIEELYLVNITTGRIEMVLRDKEWSRLSKLSFERCEQDFISLILDDASNLQTLQILRFKNTRVEKIVDQCADMCIHEMEFENLSLPGALLIDIANQFSKHSKALKCNVRNSIILSTNIKDIFAKMKNICRNFESPIIKDRLDQTSNHQIDHLHFETNH